MVVLSGVLAGTLPPAGDLVALAAAATTLAGVAAAAVRVGAGRAVATAQRRAEHSAARALEAEARLEHAGRHDRLTGLPNRDALLDHVAAALAAAGADRQVGLLVVEVDRFEALTDGVGAGGAQQVLAHVAARLRAAWPDGAVVARAGDARFAVLLEDVGVRACTSAARRLAGLVAEPLDVDGDQVCVTCVTGVVVSGDPLGDPAELLLSGEEAARAARSGAHRGWAVFDRAMREHGRTRAALEVDLRRALRDGAVGVRFAPTVRLASGPDAEHLETVRAVPRWVRTGTDGGEEVVAPQRFLALADDLGLGAVLGFQLLDRALDALARWDATGVRVPSLTVGLTRDHARDPELAHTVAARLAARDVEPGRLAVEVPVALLDDDDVVAALGRLRSLGVRVVAEGPGRAGTALASLGTAPVDAVVVDRGLVAGPVGGQTVARHLVALCHDLGLATVADGVDTLDHLASVRMLGIGSAQGAVFGGPVEAHDVVALLPVWAGPSGLRAPRARRTARPVTLS